VIPTHPFGHCLILLSNSAMAKPSHTSFLNGRCGSPDGYDLPAKRAPDLGVS